jgi:hypothetical protein
MLLGSSRIFDRSLLHIVAESAHWKAAHASNLDANDLPTHRKVIDNGATKAHDSGRFIDTEQELRI